MSQLNSSDVNPTMVASRTFDSILEQILSSNLNFQLQISPFSANISLKKTPIKDLSGSPVLPPPKSIKPSSDATASTATDLAAYAAKTIKLEKDLSALRRDYEDAVEDSAAAHLRLKSMESQPTVKVEALYKELSENNDLVDSLRLEISNLKSESIVKESIIEDQKEEIEYLEKANKKANQISNNLNKEFSTVKVKFNKEKELILKEHKAEVKAWRIELGEETKLKIKLEEQLSKSHEILTKSSSVLALPQPPVVIESSSNLKDNSKETLCSICAVSIVNYMPVYFLGERFNPACDKCKESDNLDGLSSAAEQESLTIDPELPFTPRGFNFRPIKVAKPPMHSLDCCHSQQCIVRQPFPPPLPALVPIVNTYSMYHMKTMAGELDWGSTCSYCMRIEYEKYGCDSCVWMKCYGNLHGYPDLDPYYFKKYL